MHDHLRGNPDRACRRLGILKESGVLSVVCYRGHPGGMEEAAGVVEFAEGLQDQGASVVISGQEDTEAGPFLVIMRKE